MIPAHIAGAGALEIEQNGSGFAVRRWRGFADDTSHNDMPIMQIDLMGKCHLDWRMPCGM